MQPPFWAKPKFVLSLIFLYLLAHLGIGVATEPELGADGMWQSLYSQRYAWAYSYKAPPLPAWLLATMAYVLPVDAVSNALLRYALLAVLYIFIYLAARRLIHDPRLSALSVYSFAAMGPFAEASHHGHAHSTPLAALLAVSWYLFARLAVAPQLGWYLTLGAVFGLGTLAKWNFVIFAAALFLACLLTRDGRRLVMTWKVVPAAALAAAIVLPTVVATLNLEVPAGQDVRSLLHARAGTNLAQIVDGTLNLLHTTLIFALPLYLTTAIILGLPMWRGLRALRRDAAAEAVGAEAHEQTPAVRPDAVLVGLTIAIGFAMLWGFVLVLGASAFKVRYLYPVLLILPVWLFMVIEPGRPSPRALRLFALVMAAFVIFVAGKRATRFIQVTDCGSCAAWRPYGPLAGQLANAGFTGDGTILADGAIGGNMRTYFPDARIVVPGVGESAFPAPSGQNQCLLIWSVEKERERRNVDLPQLEAHLVGPLRGQVDTPYTEATITAPMHEPVEGTFSLNYRLYAQPNGECR